MDNLILVAIYALIICFYLRSMTNLFTKLEENFAKLLAQQREEICKIIEESASSDKNS